jgi:hypothetical protein
MIPHRAASFKKAKKKAARWGHPHKDTHPQKESFRALLRLQCSKDSPSIPALFALHGTKISSIEALRGFQP